MDRSKLLKMLIMLSMIVVIAGALTRLVRGDSMSLAEYAELNSDRCSSEENPAVSGNTAAASTAPAGDPVYNSQNPSMAGNTPDSTTTGSSNNVQASAAESTQDNELPPLTGAALNGTSQLEQRVSMAEGFYYEPLSDNLRRYITGISYPVVSSEEEAAALAVNYDDLRYVHVLHYDFEGNPAEGELICNEYIAQDLVEIFYELYYSEYQIERMVLIDEYDGDDTASMEDNNTSCFNYRVVEGSSSLSKHACGLAIDINPLYNPYVTYEKDGTEKVSPVAALGYADRSVSFPYKIDEEDLCCRLFKEHGFIWGGNWNSLKDYQHFQKTPK